MISLTAWAQAATASMTACWLSRTVPRNSSCADRVASLSVVIFGLLSVDDSAYYITHSPVMGRFRMGRQFESPAVPERVLLNLFPRKARLGHPPIVARLRLRPPLRLDGPTTLCITCRCTAKPLRDAGEITGGTDSQTDSASAAIDISSKHLPQRASPRAPAGAGNLLSCLGREGRGRGPLAVDRLLSFVSPRRCRPRHCQPLPQIGR